tara:strand:+ start:209 stop:661 length:453 start_codon:yes stop_codon:yes gene_type:complete
MNKDIFLSDNKLYVGTSLSFCVRDILDGKMPLDRVIGMESGTRIKTLEQLDCVIDDYLETYWEGHSKKDAKAIAYHLFLDIPFYQARFYNYLPVGNQKPTWMSSIQAEGLSWEVKKEKRKARLLKVARKRKRIDKFRRIFKIGTKWILGS